MKKIALAAMLAAGLGLSACSSGTSVTPARVQAVYAMLKADFAVYAAQPGADAKAVAAVASAEAQLDPLVAGLSSPTPPMDVASVVGDMSALIGGIPTANLSPKLQSDIAAARALLEAVALVAG